jgi:hypothetical protein
VAKPKPRHDFETLQKVLHVDVHYEVDALRATFGHLPLDGQCKTWAENFALEACLRHSRNLIEFFFPTENVRTDRVIAKDYVDDWGVETRIVLEGQIGTAWTSKRFAKLFGQTPKDVHEAISSRLDHILAQRVDKLSWDCSNLAQLLLAVWTDFASRVPERFHQ